MSPSNSEGSVDDQDSSSSIIPPAHHEYEKMLQQLEAECRQHIRCEQQMKLHMECLQEKIDFLNKEQLKAREQSAFL